MRGILRTINHARGATQIAAANFVRPRQPWKLTWALTYWCQYKCATCNIWKKRPQNELSLEEIKHFLKRNRAPAWLDLTGGEIFLRKDLDEILESITQEWSGIAILHYATNGYKTQQIVNTTARLAASSPARIVVTVSIDGHKELNDEIRGIAGGYERQIETFKRLRQLPGVKTYFGITLSKKNASELETAKHAISRDCGGLEPEAFHVNVMQTSGHYYDNEDTTDLLPEHDALRQHIAQVRSDRRVPRTPSEWLEGRYLMNFDEFLTHGHSPVPCHSLHSSCFIDPWGKVFPCITWSQSIGALRDHELRLEPIWQSEQAKISQKAANEGRCPGCWTLVRRIRACLETRSGPAGAEGLPRHCALVAWGHHETSSPHTVPRLPSRSVSICREPGTPDQRRAARACANRLHLQAGAPARGQHTRALRGGPHPGRPLSPLRQAGHQPPGRRRHVDH